MLNLCQSFRPLGSVLLLAVAARAFTLSSFEPTASLQSSLRATGNSDAESSDQSGAVSRREMSSILVGVAVLPFMGAGNANAFANKISDKYDDRPKRRGPQPKDLGVATRKDMIGEEYTGLKNCGPAPNCFCSTDDAEDDPDHVIPAWLWPEGYDQEAAFKELEAVVNEYSPGQGGIDGGGFAIQKSDPAKGYLYAQFEALKNGYVDDLEFAVVSGMGDRAVQLRSSSRVGYLDYGVNAKRVNYIAKALKAKGWNAPGVDFKTHPDYASQNNVA